MEVHSSFNFIHCQARTVNKITLSSLPLLGALTLACAEGLEPVPFQGVGGTVEYRGQLPTSTEWVRVGAFQELPQTIFELLDFSVARKQYRLRGKRAFLRGIFWQSFGLAALVNLCLVIPVLGWAAYPCGVAGATLLYCDSRK